MSNPTRPQPRKDEDRGERHDQSVEVDRRTQSSGGFPMRLPWIRVPAPAEKRRHK